MNGGVKDLDSNAWWLNSSLPEPQHSFSKGTQICYPNPGAGISYLFSSLLKLADTPFICRGYSSENTLACHVAAIYSLLSL